MREYHMLPKYYFLLYHLGFSTQRTYGGGAHNRRDDRSDYRRVDREDPGTQQRDHVPANRYSRDSYGSRERRYARDSRFSRDVRYKDHSINDKSNGSRFTGRRNAIMGQSIMGQYNGSIISEEGNFRFETFSFPEFIKMTVLNRCVTFCRERILKFEMWF